MKKLLTFLLLLLLSSCSNLSENDNENVPAIDEAEAHQYATENFRTFSSISATHKISIGCNGEYLPVRKTNISHAELKFSNSGNEHAKLFNDSLIIAYLYIGQSLELLDEIGDFYKIKFDYKNNSFEGYIIKTYCNKSTIQPLKDHSIEIGNTNLIMNPELIPYCKTFVSEKFLNLLTAGVNSPNPLNHLKKVLYETQTELLLFSMFIGQSTRNQHINSNRIGGDETHLIYCVKNDYYVYDFENYTNMFYVKSPNLPEKISSFSFDKDTVRFEIVKLDETKSKRTFKLYPMESKRSFTSNKGQVWILNDTLRLVDISYITELYNVRESQIGHGYFYQILENFIQEILPKRGDTYLEHY